MWRRIAYLITATALLLFSCRSMPEIPGQDTAANTWIDPQNARVLIVGVLTYADASLGNFDTYHRKDVELADAFRAYGIPDDHITTLYDENATLENMQNALMEIAAVSDAHTQFIFYFAGHGFNGYNANADAIYFANSDISANHPSNSGFNIAYLSDVFIPAFHGDRMILMADCCKSGGLVAVAESFAAQDKQAIALCSCFYTDWSTGNWTFTQKIIDGLSGDALMDADKNGNVDLGELKFGIAQGLKFIDRQRPDFYSSVSDAVCVAFVGDPVLDLPDTSLRIGDYVFAKHLNNWVTVQITGKENGKYTGRYYNYADYLPIQFLDSEWRKPYFVHYPAGSEIWLDNYKDKPGTVLDVDDDFMELQSDRNGEIQWCTYECVLHASQIPALIQNAQGNWLPGKVLESEGGMYYISYDDKQYAWDEWVPDFRVQF
ncbi:MAG: caspase family protein [Chitinophagales bacterium]